MSPELDTANKQTAIDPSIYWERSGVLARASSQGALFSLYLAMQQHSLAEPFEIEAVTSNVDAKSSIEAQLVSLNHYRRPSLAANEREWKEMHMFSSLVTKDYESARLYLSMKPAPLSQSDDANRIPDDVIDNCSLASQKRLKKQYANTVKEDNTLLYDILSSQDTNNKNSDGTAAGMSSFENII
ncbi:hypothetical protein KL866_19960 [Alteromonas sp. ALT199]|uniref:VC2046/SO_2500 family protein n=1 Tax=unclassified Alteromonas TaxID=2614992 RepID=UPI00045369D8|nr:VC2046/SO_2500 family protein [Alteromonas sp. ALT199]MBT3137325.1 hypothetical protein [Alteromonas sp. ALT199]